MTDRTILHCDMNNFYASVECLYHPALRGKPVAVGGEVEVRHGIILAKNYEAKKYGIQTGEALWQAKQKCPSLTIVPPSFDKYLRFSRLAREIYGCYTDRIESFGLDECWLDLTGSEQIFGDGKAVADKLREHIKFELGVTISVGVSYNKIFAKLGSDMLSGQRPRANSRATAQISIRDNELFCYERQAALDAPTNATRPIEDRAFALYKQHHTSGKPIRSLGVRGTGLVTQNNVQLSFLEEAVRIQKQNDLELAIDGIRGRFGHGAILRGIVLTDAAMAHIDPKGSHVVHPEPFGW